MHGEILKDFPAVLGGVPYVGTDPCRESLAGTLSPRGGLLEASRHRVPALGSSSTVAGTSPQICGRRWQRRWRCSRGSVSRHECAPAPQCGLRRGWRGPQTSRRGRGTLLVMNPEWTSHRPKFLEASPPPRLTLLLLPRLTSPVPNTAHASRKRGGGASSHRARKLP